MRKLYSLLALLVFVSCSDSSPIKLNVMTFNMRCDNRGDSLNNWEYRRKVAAQIISNENIDIVGTQEVLFNQLEDLKDLLPTYSVVGVGREDGINKGEFNAILFKRERFTEIRSSNFWLSETPEIVGSKGWDGACERMATWVVLEDKESKKKLFFINTHLDHVGVSARRKGVALLLDKANRLGAGVPIVMTGDFNATPDSDVIQSIIDKSNPKHLMHAKDITSTSSGTQWTFHDFGRLPVDKREFIDYIFVGNTIDVHKYTIVAAQLDGIYLSDHVPVVAHIEVE